MLRGCGAVGLQRGGRTTAEGKWKSKSVWTVLVGREGVEELSVFLCNAGKSVGSPLESAKRARRYLALVMRGDGGGRWQLSVVLVSTVTTLPNAL